MILNDRIELLSKLREYILSDNTEWQLAKQEASIQNGWFIPDFVELAVSNIARNFLERGALEQWTARYRVPSENPFPKKVGIVMAGNIPLVGFHDFLSVFISGNKAVMKPSSRDKVLIEHLTGVLESWDPNLHDMVAFSEMLKNCDAYIATGSGNTSRYFEYYFGKYRHVIRRNKTSVAILSGTEGKDELEHLADDVYQFFGLGCRNVTKIYVPLGYNFETLLAAFRKYNQLADHHKYKNNYDYNLAIHILNNKFYMTNGSILLTEDRAVFSPISQLNYEYYVDRDLVMSSLHDNQDIQCVTGGAELPFGAAQSPTLVDYADRVDTMEFLQTV